MSNFPIKICRACENTTKLVNISLPKKKNVVNQLLACTSVTFDLNDKLPKYLCQECLADLNTAYRFKEQCEKTHHKLYKLYSEVCDDVPLKPDPDPDPNSNGNAIEPNNTVKLEPKDSIKTEEEHIDNYSSDENNDGFGEVEVLLELQPIGEIKTQLPNDTKKNKCTECSKTFSNQSNMVRHVRVVHQQEKRYFCDICKIAYADMGTIRKHMVTHTHNYACRLCDRTFKTESRLKTHRIKHLPPDERIIEKRLAKKKYQYKFEGICQYCGKFFTHRGSFREHKRTHTGERPYECDICHRRFALPKTLQSHYHIHTGEKPFQCDLCGLAFRQRMLLKVHKVNHHSEGARPHQCEYCPKSFAMRGTLNAHTRIHTGETRYECAQCGAKFIDLTQLKRHKKKHETTNAIQMQAPKALDVKPKVEKQGEKRSSANVTESDVRT